MRARLIVVDGKLIAGTPNRPFLSHLEFKLSGVSADQDDANIQKEIVGHGPSKLPYSKVLLAKNGSTVSLHGKPKHSWIKLANTAKAGSTTLVLDGEPSGWEVISNLCEIRCNCVFFVKSIFSYSFCISVEKYSFAFNLIHLKLGTWTCSMFPMYALIVSRRAVCTS